MFFPRKNKKSCDNRNNYMKIVTITVAINSAGPNGRICFIVYLKAVIWSNDATNRVTKVSIGER